MRVPNRERGATIVEGALVVLLLFTLLIAIIEFSRVYNIYQTITNAAREGARFGVAPCQSGDKSQTACTFKGATYQSGFLPPASMIRDYVIDFLRASSIPATANDVTITFPEKHLTGTSNGVNFDQKYEYLRVDVRASYDWLIFPFPNLTLRANSVMKNELDLEQ